MTTASRRTGWRTSTYSSNGGDCVEIGFTPAGVDLRDTKDRGAGPVIHFAVGAWAAFVRETLDGLPSDNGTGIVTRHGGVTAVRSIATGAVLRFTPGEWTAFVGGARDGEFDCPERAGSAVG